MLSILLVEDDPILGQGLDIGLQQRDCIVTWVQDGLVARRQARENHYDCILLDLQLPGLNGVDLLRHWRDTDMNTPVLIITARDAIDDRVLGLDLGADDYIVKPFSTDELAARLRAVYRRRGGSASPTLQHGDITLEPLQRRVQVQEHEVSLTTAEFNLLQSLLEHGRRVATREFLERNLSRDGAIQSNSIEVHIHSLRRKLGKDKIRTVRGVGYIIA
jgi:DNA-binding response OmpR family regulator